MSCGQKEKLVLAERNILLPRAIEICSNGMTPLGAVTLSIQTGGIVATLTKI